MLADNHVRPRLEPLAAKVPETTIGFWVLKLLTTAMGEAASDYLLSTMSFVGFGIGVAGFVSTLWIQFRTRRYNAFAYSAAVMMIAVFGTMAADVIHHQLGVSFTMSTLFCALGVAATFWAWHRIENTLSVHSIATRRREVFYWLTVSFTFALGTAAGDLTASQLHFGFVDRSCCSQLSWPCRHWAIGVFTSTESSPSGGHTSQTRPLGASIADWLSKPTKTGGLDYGDGPAAAGLLMTALVVVTYVAVRNRPKVTKPVPAQLKSAA